jgi:predicted ArsR family transcriptional regulator
MTSCPFQELAREFPQLACGLNLDLVRGVLERIGGQALRADLNPEHDGCCVVVTAS